MISGRELVDAIRRVGVTHVVWLPDAATGAWEEELANSTGLQLVRVCREGEAWAIAGGLWLGGKRPLIIVQNTGLFESGDAMRNILFDLRLPLYALIGYRNYLTPQSNDTARRFTEPILRAWELDYVILDGDEPLTQFTSHYRDCFGAGHPGVALLPEGRG